MLVAPRQLFRFLTAMCIIVHGCLATRGSRVKLVNDNTNVLLRVIQSPYRQPLDVIWLPDNATHTFQGYRTGDTDVRRCPPTDQPSHATPSQDVILTVQRSIICCVLHKSVDHFLPQVLPWSV